MSLLQAMQIINITDTVILINYVKLRQMTLFLSKVYFTINIRVNAQVINYRFEYLGRKNSDSR